MAKDKPSLFTDLTNVAAEGSRGLLLGALIGVIGGAIIGAAMGAIIPGLLIGAAAASGAMFGAGFIGSYGSLAGAMRGFFKPRQAEAASGQDVVNMANIAFAQGYDSGKEQALKNPAKAQEQSTQFRELVSQKKSEQEKCNSR
jgi:hypothetical protein